MMILDTVNEEMIETHQVIERMCRSFHTIDRLFRDLKSAELVVNRKIITDMNNILIEANYLMYDIDQHIKESVTLIEENRSSNLY